MKTSRAAWLSSAAALTVISQVQGQFVEIEPNETRAAASVLGPLADGATITGAATAQNQLDYFRLRIAGAPPAIYRHRVILTSSTPGHAAHLRGRSQTDGVIDANSDVVIQSAAASPSQARTNQWYGFGREEEIWYRIQGGAATTEPYQIQHLVTMVEPVDVGIFEEGFLRLTTVDQGHTTDTDFWVFDAAFAGVPGCGNDDPAGRPGARQAELVRPFSPGVFYIAISTFDVMLDLPSDQADEAYRSGRVAPGPGMVVESSPSAVAADISLAIADHQGSRSFTLSRAGPFEVQWLRMEVVPSPQTGACCLARCECILHPPEVCEFVGGQFAGVGVPCDTESCLPNRGCPCDWNGDGGLDSQDFFDFINEFGEGQVDFNCDGFSESQDYFDFLNCFFDGCG